MYSHLATRGKRLSAEGEGKAVAINLGPELLPALLGVQQTAQTENYGCSLFLPLRSAPTQSHLHQCLAGRLRHPRAYWLVLRLSLRIPHPVLLVAEVTDRLVESFCRHL